MASFPPENPYEAPRADLVEPGDFMGLPDTLAGRILLVLRLYASNLSLIAVLVLLVWLPASAAIESALARSTEADVTALNMRLNNLVELMFGPLVASAILWSLEERRQGREPSVSAALKAGLNCWGRLFVARMVAGFIILVGLIALIAPGVYFALKFCLIDAVVVLEDAGPDTGRARSGSLIRGRMLEVAFVWLLFLIPAFLVSIGLSLASEHFPDLQGIGPAVIIDCVCILATIPMTITFLVYYWEARHREDLRLLTSNDDVTTGDLPGQSPMAP